ncbi:hypothetical protein [uncultured Bacteroides sp.]|nr:hypothetical protein [uncultured Bacteroides sp.]
MEKSVQYGNEQEKSFCFQGEAEPQEKDKWKTGREIPSGKSE